MKRLFYAAALLFPFVQLAAQNLVPDPGFENMVKTPGDAAGNSIFCTRDWIVPSYSSGDYYNTASVSKVGGVPDNEFGNQQPHSGKGYAGFCIQDDMIEYLQTKLTSTMVKGEQYLIELYISKGEKRGDWVKEFGILFTDKIQLGYNRKGIPHKPPVDFTKEDGYKEEKEWIKLSATYTAEGFEAAMIVGYFNYDQPKGFKGKAHYYIDDVSVISLTKKAEPVKTVVVKDTVKKELAPKIGETITMKNIFFDTDKSDLLPSSFAELDKLALFLKDNAATTIQVSGHTDKTGNEEHNRQLSENRAKAVTIYLEKKGIDKTRLTYKGMGSSSPLASNDTEEGRQQNRRVEFVIKNK